MHKNHPFKSEPYILTDARKKHLKKLHNKVRTKEWIAKISSAQKGKPRLYMQGEKHWKWKGGLEFCKRKDERNDPRYLVWVKMIKIRDKQCKLKDEMCDGNLVVHHIKSWRDYPDLRYDLENGITLCHAHHPRKRQDEKTLMPILQKLIYN